MVDGFRRQADISTLLYPIGLVVPQPNLMDSAGADSFPLTAALTVVPVVIHCEAGHLVLSGVVRAP